MPITVTLSDPHFQYIVQVVQERPYREAAPVINELFKQAQGQIQQPSSAKPSEPANTVLHDRRRGSHAKNGADAAKPAGD